MTNTMWDPNVGNVTNPAFASVGVGAGGFIDAVSGIAGHSHYSQKLIMPVTAVANTDFVVSVPLGCTITSMMAYTSVAYTAVTDCKLQVGNVAAGAQYVSAVSIAAIGEVTLTIIFGANTPALLSMPAPPNIFVRLVQTGTATAVGSAVLLINYVI